MDCLRPLDAERSRHRPAALPQPSHCRRSQVWQCFARQSRSTHPGAQAARSEPAEMSSIEQAGSNGVLVDQNGRAVYYSTHMDPIYFAFTQKYMGRTTTKMPRPRSPIPSLRRSSRHRGASCSLAKIPAVLSPPLPPSICLRVMARAGSNRRPGPARRQGCPRRCACGRGDQRSLRVCLGDLRADRECPRFTPRHEAEFSQPRQHAKLYLL